MIAAGAAGRPDVGVASGGQRMSQSHQDGRNVVARTDQGVRMRVKVGIQHPPSPSLLTDARLNHRRCDAGHRHRDAAEDSVADLFSGLGFPAHDRSGRRIVLRRTAGAARPD
ncbi:hypothetical protein Pa4123_92000 [Phytohabitans aurantiacus]|uniref:Uncharacterized protein n=1 Tax=Phytohabitans aurantiacus TaxID=3016789 RepID=A0ABQ5RB07_9ACTN|nr:hypothetical protein Pa4123_92000 [Phytohabitans aurantiacus]